jgi:hypothetical protein
LQAGLSLGQAAAPVHGVQSLPPLTFSS